MSQRSLGVGIPKSHMAWGHKMFLWLNGEGTRLTAMFPAAVHSLPTKLLPNIVTYGGPNCEGLSRISSFVRLSLILRKGRPHSY